MRKNALILIALIAMFIVPASANASTTPFLPQSAAWSKTFDFAHTLANRMDDGDYKDVIPIVNSCTRQSRSRVDCGYEINFFPWSFDDSSAMTCTDTLRIRKYNSGSVRVYLPGHPDCVTI